MDAPGAGALAPAEPRWVRLLFMSVFVAAFVAAVLVGGVLAVTLPYHDWDAFAFGELSRAVADGRYSITDFGPAVVQRPLFYVLQGWSWAIFGLSFTAGRLLSLGFFVILIASTARLPRANGSARRLESALAGIVVLCIPVATNYSIAGLSDVPAAAMLAATAAVALTTRDARARGVGLGLLTLLAVMTKPSVLVPLAGLLVAVAVADAGRDRLRFRQRGDRELGATVAPLAVGLAIGLALHALAAARLGVGMVDYLTAGTGGYWSERAASERWDALLRVDVLGPALRLPLAFVILYAPLRGLGLSHRLSATGSLSFAMLWTIVGSTVAAEGDRQLWSPEASFAWIGFLVLLALFTRATSDDAPTRLQLTRFSLIALPPLVVWVYATPYADRLAATAWPGLAVLVALVIAVPVRRLAQTAGVAAAAPAIVLCVALWASFASFDGLSSDQWRELRSLGAGGIRDDGRTLNIVLPAIQESNELIGPAMGTAGRLSTSDPRFSYWFPNRVNVDYVTTCAQLDGYAAFILLTSDESRAQVEEKGGSGDPAWWARCEHPQLRQASDGSNGYAVFLVGG